MALGMVVAVLVGLVLVGGLLLLTDVLALEALGGFMLWIVGMVTLLALAALVALGVRAVLFRGSRGDRGGRVT